MYDIESNITPGPGHRDYLNQTSYMFGLMEERGHLNHLVNTGCNVVAAEARLDAIDAIETAIEAEQAGIEST